MAWCTLYAVVGCKMLSRGCVLKKSTFRSLGSSVPRVLFRINPEVQFAVASGKPVVALETTILTHGMPYPDNVHTALQVEDIIRSYEVTPATIGVLQGQVHIGMTSFQLKELGKPGEKRFKVSRRDLAYVLSKGLSGGTTVSGTMLCAHRAGIPLFVTGGIGGVHREGESSFDISADLTELGRTPVGVVCAGVKSILDIGRTLEYLETQGVTVASYGESREFPAFFSPKSGFEAPCSVNDAMEAAKLLDASLSFGVGSGLVIGVPVPTSSGDIGEEVEEATHKALLEAKSRGVTGKAITPFLLERVNQLTRGRSLEANIALIKNNARVGSQIAVELAKLRSKKSRVKRQPIRRSSSERHPVVIGASILDSTAKVTSPLIKSEGTNPGSLIQTMGGVARNIAECMSRLGTSPFFISALGKDLNGQTISRHLTQLGMSLEGVYECSQFSTATYCVVLDHRGETYCAVGDMSINQSISVDWVSQFSRQLAEAPLVCLDGNISTEVLQYVCEVCSKAGVPVWYEPTCVDKAAKLVLAGCHSKIAYSSPNISELRSMYSALTGKSTDSTPSSELTTSEKLSECLELTSSLLSHIPHLFVSLGKDGVLSCSSREGTYLHYKPAADNLLPVSVVSVTGAGDSFVGAASIGITRGLPCDLSIKAGLRAAYESLKSHHAISTELSSEYLTEESIQTWASWQPTVIETSV